MELKFFISLVLFLGASTTASALPRFALLSGTRCSACHVNPQGSGLRTELGWQMMNETGMLQWSPKPEVAEGDEFSDLEAMEEAPATNSFFNGLASVGADMRFQWVRSASGERRIIPMQISTHLGVMPAHEVTVYGTINIASIMYRARNEGLPPIPGMSDFDAAIQIAPSYTLPSIRVGMIQPSIGIRHDDHTLFVRRETGLYGTNLLPPDYNDLGAEITYEGQKWLTLNAGIFNSYNLSQAQRTIAATDSRFSFRSPTVSARVMLWPQLLDENINGELGASILQNGQFRMYNVFGGFGIGNKATLMVEGLYSKDSAHRIIRNFSVMGSYNLVSWLSAHWRYEWGQTEFYPGVALGHSQAFVVGTEFFPLPYIELRPELRVFERVPFAQAASREAQYTIQAHLFY